jgi:hypothetical protein
MALGDASVPRSRRMMLGGLLGGLAGVVLHALGGPERARAADGGPVLIGQSNAGTVATIVTTSGAQAGLMAYGLPAGLYGSASAADGIGVFGTGPNGVKGGTYSGIGVIGSSHGGTGVQAETSIGTALRVLGPAVFERSGRVSVAAGKYYADIAPAGGLGSSASILATLQTHRSGVWVAGVRRNYPSTGKARIYLNKVASTTSSTPVAWFVLG